MPRRGWRGLVQRLLPWYDSELERRRDERTDSIHRRAIAARIEAERVRAAYRQMAERLER